MTVNAIYQCELSHQYICPSAKEQGSTVTTLCQHTLESFAFKMTKENAEWDLIKVVVILTV